MKITDTYVLVDDEHGLNDLLKVKERVIALFYASWCPFCVKFLPVFEKHTEGAELSFLVVKDDQEIMGGKYSVEVVPTVLFFEKGKVTKRLEGILGVGLNEKQLTDFIHRCANPGGVYDIKYPKRFADIP
jgi:thioredoxin 1